MCHVLTPPVRVSTRRAFRINCHRADAWYVRAYMALPVRFSPWTVMPARVGQDCHSHVKFVRL
jgi:hypothetical protein